LRAVIEAPTDPESKWNAHVLARLDVGREVGICSHDVAAEGP
jgi:hypothetical protein